jgi:hypothetical protein
VFDTSTNDEDFYFDIEENNFGEFMNNPKIEDHRKNVLSFLKEDNISENINVIDDIKDKAYFYSQINFFDFKKMNSKKFINKDSKHFVNNVKERLEKISKN